MKLQTLLASLLISGSAMAQSTAIKPVVLKSPYDYQILAISGNGKWACGAYVDFSNNTYGFLWNLDSGEIEMLNAVEPSVGFSVSDNGIVVGTFTDNTYKANGAATTLAGYWANHKWNRLEMPADDVSYACAYSISPDGHYVTGTVNQGEFYTGYIWKDGKIEKELMNSGISIPYAVSPDGQMAAGWMQGKKNRRACLWEADGDVTWLTTYENPWSSGRKFSPDGSKLLYWGYWNEDGDAVNAVYDMATRTVTPATALDTFGDFDFFDVSNSGTVVGANGSRGYIWKDGKAYWADKYLTSMGVDLAAEHVVVMPETDYYCIYRASVVSGDDKVMGFQFYNDDVDETGTLAAALQSMIVKFDQPTTGLCPANVEASQLSGLTAVMVSWKANIVAEGITGYNVYRDGEKINSELVTANGYVDAAATMGEHRYTVTAVYGSDESAKSDEVSVTVAKNSASAPTALYAQQRGYSNAYMSWNAPVTNFGSLTYFNTEDANIEGFGFSATGMSYETAVLFDAVQTSAYKGHKISSVAFYPMSEQSNWKVNLYTHDAEGKLQLVYSQPVTQTINYGERNEVALATPVDVPDGDLVVAVELTVTTPSQNITALDYGRTKQGYTDLVRLSTDDDFYSFGELYQSEGYVYPATWAIDATVIPAEADVNSDRVDHYNIYADGTNVGSSASASYTVQNLNAGEHTLGVNAVYADGKESPIHTANVNITPDDKKLAAVDNVNVTFNSAANIHAAWNVPADNDKTTIQYSSDEASNRAIKGSKSNNYGIMAGALYPAKLFKGRQGYQISSVRFYPLNDAAFTAMIYKNDVQICELPIDEYTLKTWNEVKLEEPIDIDPMASYQLVIDCYDVTPDMAPLAVDNNSPVEGYSDLYSFNGESWSTLYADASVSCNWLIGLNIVNTKTTALPVAGYDVNIDGEKKNTEMLKDNQFDYDFASADSKNHTISVDVYYTVKAQSLKGGVTTFKIDATGIGDNAIQRIVVRQGDNYLTVDGGNVSALTLVNAAGATVASANGNTVSLNGLTAGVYVVKAVVDGENIVRKVQVVK